MSVTTNIPIPADALEALCRKWRVRVLSLFGSVLRDDFGPNSDVDVLGSFDDDALAEMFGRPVDLVEREGVRNPFRRQRILETRLVIYGAGRE
jgi:uncharacterized protein